MINPEANKNDIVEEVSLPGFRFHPTDEELVTFYLRRKINKKPIRLDLIKQIDIYKHNPWDLTSATGSVGEAKEWYYFCKRGRKYKNSIRPNRVTGSGFWKATGIDKPIYSHGGEGHDCVGLKKTLVYYRGCAGKGSKTDWMMHEFRLPTNPNNTDDHSTQFEAEIWTLCRIFKRNMSCKKFTPNWRDVVVSNKSRSINPSSKTSSSESDDRENYINFSSQSITYNEDQKPVINNVHDDQWSKQLDVGHFSSNILSQSTSIMSPSSRFSTNIMDGNDLFTYGSDWEDDFRSVMEFALDPNSSVEQIY